MQLYIKNIHTKTNIHTIIQKKYTYTIYKNYTYKKYTLYNTYTYNYTTKCYIQLYKRASTLFHKDHLGGPFANCAGSCDRTWEPI